MSAWMAMDRFWVDVMNVGVALLVLVPLAFVARAALKDWFSRGRKLSGAGIGRRGR